MIRQLVTVIVIVCLAGVVVGQNRLIQFNESYSTWMTQDEVDKLAVECGAGKGFMDITDFPDLGKISAPKMATAFPVNPIHQKEVHPLLQHVNKHNIHATVTKLSSYRTRGYRDQTGVESATWLLNEYKRIAGSRTDIKVDFFPNTFIQPNIIARIEGTGPTNEIVILGGHIDSISNGATAPGADDDASGSACVLEVFRVLVEHNFKPLRTLEFHGYGGEEAGLLGSQAIATDYLRNARNVIAMLQLDMVGYVAPGTSPTIGIITDYTSAAFNVFLRNVADTYVGHVQRRDSTCGYACSDHGSWNKAGYVAAFPFEGTFANRNPRIHTISDLTDIMNFDHAKSFADLALATIVELSLD